jgi:DNA-binding MarR family transcriptional regulator
VAIGTELEQALGRILLRRNRARLYDVMLGEAPDAVDEHTYPVLSGIARVGPATSAELAAEIGVDRSRISRHADRLQDAGLIHRSPSPDDARATLLTLTRAGEAEVARLRSVLAGHLDEIVAGWPDGLAEALVDGLTRLADPGD